MLYFFVETSFCIGQRDGDKMAQLTSNAYLFSPEDGFFLLFAGVLIKDARIIIDPTLLIAVILCLFAFGLFISTVRAKRDGHNVGRIARGFIFVVFLVFFIHVLRALPEVSYTIGFFVIVLVWLVAVYLNPILYDLAHEK